MTYILQMGLFCEFVNKKEPSLKKELFDHIGKYKIFLVNGKEVRDSSPKLQEFGGSSIHAYLSSIPKDEIWIEDDIEPDEREVLINSALYQLKKIEQGKSTDKAYSEGIRREKDYRESIYLSEKLPWKTNKPAPKEIYIKKYGIMDEEQILVYLVDGEKTRNTFKSDFIEGGHGYVYPWIPNNEIWIEYGPNVVESPLILLHEYVERTLMKYKKIGYNKAHTTASKVEFEHRPNKISREQALSLTPENAMLLAKLKL